MGYKINAEELRAMANDKLNEDHGMAIPEKGMPHIEHACEKLEAMGAKRGMQL